MARVNGGFLGDLAGSVGNVTFARARGGIQTARRRTGASNPRTAAQQRHRGRFKQIQRFSSAFLSAGLVRAFWQPYATNGLSAFNAFMKTNSAAMPDGLDPMAARISRGNELSGVTLASVAASAGTPNLYELSVESLPTDDPEDLLVGAIYNAARSEAVIDDSGITRDDAVVGVLVPPTWAQEDEDALFAYAFAYRVEGTELVLSGSSARKVNGNAFEVPAPDVPPARTAQQVPYGQTAG